MTKKSPEVFSEICDLTAQNFSYRDIAKQIGVGEPTVYRWLADSQRNPESYSFEWGGVHGALHEHARTAYRMAAHGVESTTRQLAAHGHRRVAIFGGRVMFQECEIKAMCPGDLEWYVLCDGCADPYKRDPNTGERIPLMIEEKPSDQLLIATNRANFPDTWGTSHSTVEHEGSVRIISHSRNPKVIEQKALQPPAEQRLADLRAKMLAEAEQHLADPNRVTKSNYPLPSNLKFNGSDTVIRDTGNRLVETNSDGEIAGRPKVRPPLTTPPLPPKPTISNTVLTAPPPKPAYARED